MEKDCWQDPLLLTEVSWQQDPSKTGITSSNSSNRSNLIRNCSKFSDFSSGQSCSSDPIQSTCFSGQVVVVEEDRSRIAQMADLDFHSETIQDINSSLEVAKTEARLVDDDDYDKENFSWQRKNSKRIKFEELGGDSVTNEAIDGRSLLGFSLTSPDLVICADSPDISCKESKQAHDLMKTPDFIKNLKFGNPSMASIEVSLDKGINGTKSEEQKEEEKREGTHESPATTMISALFPELQIARKNQSPRTSFDLVASSRANDNKILNNFLPLISINSGGTDKSVVVSGGVDFTEDNYFVGGDVIRTETGLKEGDKEAGLLYRSARIGNFSYKFEALEAGIYYVDLHFAEIIFTDGPPGMRIFDVLIQEEKVISGIDIYAQVGSHKPLIFSELKAFVNGKNGLSIRFEGVIGSPIVCGISVRRDSKTGFGNKEFLKNKEKTQMSDQELLELVGKNSNKFTAEEGEFEKLQRDYELQYKELMETKKALESFKKDYDMKNKECQEAWMSLKELQNELMRKSMHVGSLAYAVEGQVKEKTRWFSSLRDLTKKFKLLKMEHSKLSKEASECKQCLADMTQITTSIQSTIDQKIELEREHKELKLKFIKGANERKELYNKVLELKGNIRVFCRCRPLNYEEVATGALMAVDFESAKDGELIVKANGAPKKVFKFDSIFSPQAYQADVFEDTAPFATSVLDGYNVCIFAYGQTGTGKTFTMEGTEEARGVNYRTLEELFRIIKDRERLYRYEISVSVLEVYNEQIRDLLIPASSSQPGVAAKRLEIRQVAEGAHHVPGLVEAHVSNMNEAWEVLQTGSNARAVGSTNSNEHSSRSHCIHCVMVKGENLMNGECARSKLWLVDLAGSERVAKTDVQGERLKEAQNINRSLSALGDVISSLANKSPHIPFRNSKLTHLLQDSLGGDSKALMFVQISPNENDLSETLCSLNFASRVRGIELGPAKKQLDSSELQKHRQMAEKVKQEMKSKDGCIKKLEETVQSLEQKVKARDLNNKNLQEKVKELESQLLVERKLARQHVDTKIAELQHQQQQQKQQQEDQNLASSMRPPLGAIAIGNHKTLHEPSIPLAAKDDIVMNSIRPLMENNNGFISPLITTSITTEYNNNNLKEKENTKPDLLADQPALLPKKTGRLSICPPARRVPDAPAPRRNSLIPLPSGAPRLLEIITISTEPIKEVTEISEAGGLKEGWNEPVQRKKFSNILRRSIQKKIQIRSPMQQHMMRRGGGVGGGGNNGRMEKVRLSIGSRSRSAQQRVLISSKKDLQQKQQNQNQKEKEKGWNL